MSLTACINEVPQQARMNIVQAGIFNLNMRLMALARQQLSITNKDNGLFAVPSEDADPDFFQSRGGAFQFGKHMDGANTLAERDRSAEESARVTEEQGHTVPDDPRKQAEPLVTLRSMLMLKYYDECNKTRRTPMDQSYASVINWMHSREFTPNQREAQAVLMASKGRVSLDQAIAAQKRRHDDERTRLTKISEPLLKQMEDFEGVDLGERLGTDTPSQIDGDVIIDTLFDSLPPMQRLGITNVMWRRAMRLVTDDLPSRRIPTRDFAADIALAIAAADEFLEFAKTLWDSAHDEYIARRAGGLPEYDIVIEIENQRKLEAKKNATSLARPAKAA